MLKLSMPPLPIETSRVLFDISRLLRSRSRPFATGVDRIDLAIGLTLLRHYGGRCDFVHASRLRTVILTHEIGASLLHYLDAKWNSTCDGKYPRRLGAQLRLRSILLSTRRPHIDADLTYVVASHSGLGKVRGALRRLDPHALMKRLVYLHDIIPLQMPEYQRPGTRLVFSNYLRELTDAPLAIVSNSNDTDMQVRGMAKTMGWPVTGFSVVIPTLEKLVEALPVARAAVMVYLADPRPFFMIIGTIEPRKNHLLLLNLWRAFALDGIDTPRLCIVGKRGWENENVVDMLDRCEIIQQSICEFGNLDDHEVQRLMLGSTALLFPSFIEGLGIPLLEATALDVPCIVSDIPVFHEIAPTDTIFLDPLDGPGWKNAILSRTSGARAEVRG